MATIVILLPALRTFTTIKTVIAWSNRRTTIKPTKHLSKIENPRHRYFDGNSSCSSSNSVLSAHTRFEILFFLNSHLNYFIITPQTMYTYMKIDEYINIRVPFNAFSHFVIYFFSFTLLYFISFFFISVRKWFTFCKRIQIWWWPLPLKCVLENRPKK